MKRLIWIATLGLVVPFANAEMPAATQTPAAEASFTQVDTDQDGLITKQEAQSFAAVELIFESADVNKDGTLDITEFSEVQKPAE